MKRIHTMMFSLAIVMLTVGCSGGCTLFINATQIDTSPDTAVYGLSQMVVQDHDAYVNNDEELSQEQRAEYLGESAYAWHLVERGSVDVALLSEALNPVMDRHDEYVRNDPDYEGDPFAVEVFLGNTERLRSLFATAESYRPEVEGSITR